MTFEERRAQLHALLLEPILTIDFEDLHQWITDLIGRPLFQWDLASDGRSELLDEFERTGGKTDWEPGGELPGYAWKVPVTGRFAGYPIPPTVQEEKAGLQAFMDGTPQEQETTIEEMIEDEKEDTSK